MNATLYKWLTTEKTSPVAGNWTWKPGVWREHQGKLVPCKSGIHACRPGDLVHHIAARLWIAEADGDRVDAPDKIVVSRLRVLAPVDTITDQTLRLFAADCAGAVLPLFEREHPADTRPRDAIRATRDFAHGRVTPEELAAARAAAWRAARDADKGTTWNAVRCSAWAAAWDTAWQAAWRAAVSSISIKGTYSARFNARLLQYVEHGVAAETMPWASDPIPPTEMSTPAPSRSPVDGSTFDAWDNNTQRGFR